MGRVGPAKEGSRKVRKESSKGKKEGEGGTLPSIRREYNVPLKSGRDKVNTEKDAETL